MPDQPYQVQQTDKDLLTLAERLGINYQQLKQANPFTKSISQGQFINVPKTTLTAPPAPTSLIGKGGGDPTSALTGSFLAGGGKFAPVYVPQPSGNTPPRIRSTVLATQWLQQQTRVSPINDSTLSRVGGADRLDEMEVKINQQIQSGGLPPVIPAGVNIINPSTGAVVSNQDMLNNGYVYDLNKKQWELSVAKKNELGINAQANSQPTPAYLQTVNYNGKLVPAWKAELLAKRANRKEAERIDAANAAAERAAAAAVIRAKRQEKRSDSAQTTLSLRLGS